MKDIRHAIVGPAIFVALATGATAAGEVAAMADGKTRYLRLWSRNGVEEPVPGLRGPSITFHPSGIATGSTGLNGFKTAYVIAGGGIHWKGPFHITRRGGTEAALALEASFVTELRSSVSIRRNAHGEVELSARGGRMVFRPEED